MISFDSEVGNTLDPVLQMRKLGCSVVTDSPQFTSRLPSATRLLRADTYRISVNPLDEFWSSGILCQ